MRDEYKGLFLSDYDEYLTLHKTVQQVGAEFQRMKELLEEQAPGSEEYQVCVGWLLCDYHEFIYFPSLNYSRMFTRVIF